MAIFVDSDFWHGRLYLQGKRIPKTNQDYWIPKLKKNIQRDKYVTKALKSDGWHVLRYWESDIIKNANSIAKEIYNKYKDLKR